MDSSTKNDDFDDFDVDDDDLADLLYDEDNGNPDKNKKTIHGSPSTADEKDDDTKSTDSSLGTYIPSAARNRSATPRRQSAMFEDGRSSQSSLTPTKTVESPKKPLTDTSTNETYSFEKSPGRTPRDRNSNSNDDDNWLNLLKSKKPENVPSPKVFDAGGASDSNSNSPKKMNLNNRRKSSGAEWLALKPPEDSSEEVSGKQKNMRHSTNSETRSNVQEPRRTSDATAKGQLPWLPQSADTGAKAEISPKTTKPLQKHRTAANRENTRSPPSPGPLGQNVQTTRKMNPVSPTHVVSTPVGDGQQRMIYHNQETAFPPEDHDYINRIQYPPKNNALLAEYATMQSLITTMQLEREQLMKSVEFSKKAHEEQLQLVETSLKTQQKTVEDTLETKMNSMRREHEAQVRKLERQIDSLLKERKDVAENYRQKVEILDKEYHNEVGKLRRLHDDGIAVLKQDHSNALERLKKLKDQEVEAVSSAHQHSKSLQALSDELKARASELTALQAKIESKHQSALQEKIDLLQAKEKDLKTLETRLKWQMEEGDQERARLQQLVIRLESRLQQQTRDSEQDHWEMQQQKTKLEAKQKFLDEERKTMVENIEREKEKIHKAQEAMLCEQKAILLQITQERQMISSEKMELESLARRSKGEEARLYAKKLQEESSFESHRRMIQQEEEKLQLEKELCKQELEQLRVEKEALQREKKQLREERENIKDMKLELKRKSLEIDDLTQRALNDKEQGKAALATAHKIEEDHHSRLNELAKQMENVMEKERRLLQERESFMEEKREFHKTRNSILCSNCKLAVGLPMTALPTTVGQMRQHAPMLTMNSSIPPQVNADPNLMVWYITAQKDREYLQEELEFLQSLKEFGRK